MWVGNPHAPPPLQEWGYATDAFIIEDEFTIEQ